ncbi:MAG TPA: hypothetical protein VLT88_01780 [Desulfosarcina sp.]|nr:hypothetical protein [Desulfosarcina sp.]
MKIRNGSLIVSAVSVCLLLAAAPAWSGSKQQHRWEGVAIGAAIVGSALVHQHRDHAPATVVIPSRYHSHHRHGYRHPGLWTRNHWRGYDFNHHDRRGAWSGKWHRWHGGQGYKDGHRSRYDHRRGYDRHGKHDRRRDHDGHSDRGRGHRRN